MKFLSSPTSAAPAKASSNSADDVPFFRLPAELRHQIYTYILPTGEHIHFFSRSGPRVIQRRLFPSQLQRTCRAVRADCIALVVATNRFSVAGLRTAIVFLSMIGGSGRAALKRLELGLMQFGHFIPAMLPPRPPRATGGCCCALAWWGRRELGQGEGEGEGEARQVPRFDFDLGTLAGLLAGCVRLHDITLYIDTYQLMDHGCKAAPPGTEQISLRDVPGADALRQVLRQLPIEKQPDAQRTFKLRWVGPFNSSVGAYRQIFAKFPDSTRFMMESTVWLGPDEGCAPHGTYGTTESPVGCHC